LQWVRNSSTAVDRCIVDRSAHGGIARSLSRLKRRGIPMILREFDVGKSKTYSFSGMQKIVQRMRKDIGLPVEFTLDACRQAATYIENGASEPIQYEKPRNERSA
jgi:hypothetical protein